jgi:hypothetical protein
MTKELGCVLGGARDFSLHSVEFGAETYAASYLLDIEGLSLSVSGQCDPLV